MAESTRRGHGITTVAVTNCTNERIEDHTNFFTAMTEVTKRVDAQITSDSSINSGSLILRSLCEVNRGTRLTMRALEGANSVDCTIQTLVGVSPFLDAVAIKTKTRLLLARKVVQTVTSAFNVGISLLNATLSTGLAACVGLVGATGVANKASAGSVHGLIKVTVASTVEACTDSDETMTWHFRLTLNR